MFLARVHVSVFGENLKWHRECLELLKAGVSFTPAAQSLQFCVSHSTKADWSFKLGWREKAETVGAADGFKAGSDPKPPLNGLMAHIGFLFLFKTPLKRKWQFTNSGGKV